MEMKYITADPTGNITVLITTPYTSENRRDMIHRAFELVPECEQAGFIMSSDDLIKIEMMGYEFCGNATMSAASLQAYREGTAIGSSKIIDITSSGIDEPLSVEVRRLDDAPAPDGGCYPVFEGTVRMPVPEISSFRGMPLVSTDGISHILIPDDQLTDEEAMTLIREYASELDVPALGFMLYSVRDDNSLNMRPLVYVPVSDTLVWEHGCATGSTAAGVFRHSEDASLVDTVIHQPGGTMRIHIEDGRPYLTGKVTLRI